jgi:archaellum component FlaC
MKKSKLVVIGALAIFGFSMIGITTLSVYAQESGSRTILERIHQRQTELQRKIDDAKAKKDDIIAQRCERIATNISERVYKHRTNKEIRVAKYNEIKDRFSVILDKLESAGGEVTKLRNEINTLDEMIKDFSQTNESVIINLLQSGELACAGDREQFEKNIQISRNYWDDVKSRARAIREFIKGTIIPEIRNIRETLG